MAHRHSYGAPQIFGNESDQSHNQMQVYYTPENSSQSYAVENGTAADGVLHRFPLQNPFRQLNLQMYTPDCNSGQPRLRQYEVGPLHSPFHHPSATGSFRALTPLSYPCFRALTPLSYPCQASSSSAYARQGMHLTQDDHIITDTRRGYYKRKSHGFPAVLYERGSSSRYFSGGSLSGQEAARPMTHQFWAGPVSLGPIVYHGSPPPNQFPTSDHGFFRNVRSRVSFTPESSSTRTPFSIIPFRHHYADLENINTGHHMEVSSSGIHSQESGSDSSGNTTTTSTTYDIVGGHPFRNPAVHQIPLSSSGRAAFHTGGSSSGGSRYSHGGSPPWTSSPSSQFSEQEGPQFISRNSRSITGCRNNRNNGRWYRSGSDVHHYRSQALLFLDYHRPRDSLDRHRDLRLDVDHMSYEELLALGEMIGSVSTGLTEEMLSKAVSDATYGSSGSSKREGEACAICLEEYEEGEVVGKVNRCGHDYHSECIKKWLGLKNSCPVCKASVVVDH